MSKRKKPKTFPFRSNHISRVSRRISHNPNPTVNTVFGEEKITVGKYCIRCHTLQPLDNFYFISNFVKKRLNENDPRSRRKHCCICYDELNR